MPVTFKFTLELMMVMTMAMMVKEMINLNTVFFPGCICVKEEEKQEFARFMILLVSQRQRPCLP